MYTHHEMSQPQTQPFSMSSMWTSLHMAQHTALNRNFSAPLRNPESPPTSLHSPAQFCSDPFSRSNSLSDIMFMQQHGAGAFTTPPPPIPSHLVQGELRNCTSETSHMFAPSTAVWGESEYSVGPMCRYGNF
jgi:hypothetical protein